MSSKIEIFWTRQAQEDLREIREFIARDAPRTAEAFVRQLRQSVERLYSFPESGQIVPEIGNPSIRELIRGHYRLIYRYQGRRVDMLAVYHGARLLGNDDLT
jgi:addiction module RelE/StbE family toxin